MAASPCSPDAAGTPAPIRAERAIPVRTPPGCTTVTPVPSGRSSWRKASAKPRTANLLAA